MQYQNYGRKYFLSSFYYDSIKSIFSLFLKTGLVLTLHLLWKYDLDKKYVFQKCYHSKTKNKKLGCASVSIFLNCEDHSICMIYLRKLHSLICKTTSSTILLSFLWYSFPYWWSLHSLIIVSYLGNNFSHPSFHKIW